MSQEIRRLLALTPGCLVLLAGASGTAAASSIVFIKQNDVWLAKPDGSGQYRVTHDGTAKNPYVSPSQADDGTIVAGRRLPIGGSLYRLKQNGQLVNRIPVGALQAGPFSPAVSPDGRTVAFEHVFSRSINGYIETSSDVRFTRTDGSTPNGLGEVGRGAGAPSWIDSRRAFVGINQVATTVVPGQEPVEWWSDYDHQPDYFSFGQSVEDGEVAANGNVAVVRGEGETSTVQLYRSSGFTELPVPTCTLSGPSPGPAGKEFKDPTFAPDGSAIVWQEGNGVWTMDLPENCSDGEPRLLIAGASEPDWGPASIDPGPRVNSPSGGGLKVSAQTGRLPKVLAQGLRVRVTAPAAGKLRAVASAKGKAVATGSRSVARRGRVTLVLRFTKAARHALASSGQTRLKVRVSFRNAQGKSSARTVAVSLKG
jgi:hypothetical protein